MSIQSLIVMLAAGVAATGMFLLTRTVLDLGAPPVRRASVVQSHGGLAPEEARTPCPIALPTTASNVQFAVWSFGDDAQVWVRFEAPVADCLAHADLLLEESRAGDGWRVIETEVVGDPPGVCVLDPTEVDLAWFDLSTFSQGKVFRVAGARGPMVWVDTDRGRFYYEAKTAPATLHPES